ncbi:MAG: hypothetical protein M1819_003516 [Sarea resinae]|nr:MAG: hypothetical protein M1819_003516 [Sarea resinae]
MVQSFKITDDTRQIAIYAGMVTSAFTIAEFSTGVLWGRLSDRLGRKPVLLFGLAGTGLSMLMFGFARNLPMALIGRALGGLLNGNIGVLQTTVAEMITVKEHQPRAYAIMPFIWCLGSIVGPTLGGALAEPCVSYPSLFSRGGLFDKFPYLLPNLVCAMILAFGVMIGILFLEETHEEKKHRRDAGLEAGRWITSLLRGRKSKAGSPGKGGDANLEESRSLFEDEQPPEYRSTEGSPRISCSQTRSDDIPRSSLDLPEKASLTRKPSITKAFNKQVVLIIASYGILAYHTISFEQLMPVLLSSPISHEPASLPFKFTGGFALPTKTIGIILSLQGFYAMFAQAVLFPYAAEKFGSLRTFRFVAISWPILYVIVPYLVLLPEGLRLPGVFICLVWKITAQALAYPSNAILLTNSAPSMLVLGAINGVAASTASLSRAFGPTVSGLIHSVGLKFGYSGLSWWSSGLMCLLGAVECLFIREVEGRLDQDEDEAADEEALLDDPYLDGPAVETTVFAGEHGLSSCSEARQDDASPNKDLRMVGCEEAGVAE